MPFNAASICVEGARLLGTVAFAQDQALFSCRQVLLAKLLHGHRLAATRAFARRIFPPRHLPERGEGKFARLLRCNDPVSASAHAAADILCIAIIDEVGASAGGVNEHPETLQLAAPDSELGFAWLGGIHDGFC